MCCGSLGNGCGLYGMRDLRVNAGKSKGMVLNGED